MAKVPLRLVGWQALVGEVAVTTAAKPPDIGGAGLLHAGRPVWMIACEHLISSRVIRPGPVKLLERVATAQRIVVDLPRETSRSWGEIGYLGVPRTLVALLPTTAGVCLAWVSFRAARL